MEGKCQPQSRHPSVPSLCPGPQETPPPPRCPRSEEACLSPHSGRDTGGVGPQGEPPGGLCWARQQTGRPHGSSVCPISLLCPQLSPGGGPLFLWFTEFFHRVLSGPSPGSPQDLSATCFCLAAGHFPFFTRPSFPGVWTLCCFVGEPVGFSDLPPPRVSNGSQEAGGLRAGPLSTSLGRCVPAPPSGACGFPGV